ncbi:MAG TPA: NAD(+)/NADH kinase [Phycisphaerales bacterium]|nr:NAD(+)/NADH kinase [Phycisphaerales bacterium]
MPAASKPRVLLIANRSRPEVAAMIDSVDHLVRGHATIAGEIDADDGPLPNHPQADLAVALGGDGTMLSQARRLAGWRIPLVGVNFGRLGVLAEFDMDSLRRHATVVFGPQPPIHEHLILEVEVLDAQGGVLASEKAINDCVVTAGPPYRMIELEISINGNDGPTLTGDGVIVATPIGSTAYNVSAGGPIVQPTLDAIIITPIAAHSLAFRPIVVGTGGGIEVQVVRANAGTTLVIDGQALVPLRKGQRIRVRRDGDRARFVANPSSTYWQILLQKMRWAAPPTYRDRGA